MERGRDRASGVGARMNVEMWAGVVAIVLAPAVAFFVARAVVERAPLIAGSGVAGRCRRVVDAGISEFGPIPPALITVLAGISATFGTMWVLGKGAHRIQGGVDWPVWRWFGHHQDVGWTNAWWHITSMGSPVVTQRLVVVGGIILAIVWRRRAWWLPPVALVVGYTAEKYGQIALKLVVDRGHPPHAAMKFGTLADTHGTWPSGGCARVLIVYGLITYFVIRAHRDGRSKQAWMLGAAFVCLALTVQAYARLNNMEHWFTDVVGGAVFGTLLLTTMLAGSELVQRGMARRRGAQALTESMPSLAGLEHTPLSVLRAAQVMMIVLVIGCAVEFVARGTWTSGIGRWKGWGLAVLVAVFAYLAATITENINQRRRLHRASVPAAAGHDARPPSGTELRRQVRTVGIRRAASRLTASSRLGRAD